MVFLNIPLIFTIHTWHKLNSLSNQERSHFLAKIRQIIQGYLGGKKNQLFLEYERKVVLKIRYYSDYKIIATIVKSLGEDQLIKIIDLVNCQDLEQLNNSTEIANNFDSEDIEGLDSNLEIGDEIKKDYLWSRTVPEIKLEYFKLQEDDFWYYVIKSEGQQNPDLILSSQQYQILNNQPNLPILLTGNYGTGKTTTALHSALDSAHKHQNNVGYKILYLTCDRPSYRNLERLRRRIYPDHLDNFICRDYQSLCKYIGEKYQVIGQNKFLGQRQITAYKFREKFCTPRQLETIESITLWQEIRHLIKGSSKSGEKNNQLIPLKDYLALRQKSSVISNLDCNYIYQLANEYQNWLQNEKLWDDLDLTHYLLSNMPENYRGEYDEIYCDDIQQLTELQLQFILSFLKVEGGDNYLPKIFLTGEPEEIINSTVFSWNKVKKLLVESYHKLPQWLKIRESIELKYLNHNFHYSSTIVDVSSAILALAQPELKTSNQIFRQSSFLNSAEKTLIISGFNEEFLSGKNTFGIGNAIIVPDRAEKEKLSIQFPEDRERILTVAEIDGLKFEEVLVWKCLANFESWQPQIPLFPNPEEIKELENLEYNYLYSCIVAAKNKIYFYDDPINEIWNLPAINNVVKIGSWHELESFFNSENSRQEILETAENYANQGSKNACDMAIKLYYRGQDEFAAKTAEALRAESQGDWGRAGDIWNELSVFDEAIHCWNEVDKKLWEAKWAVLNKTDWTERGLYFEKQKNYGLAELCYQKAGDLAGKLRCLEATNQWELAGDRCLDSQQGDKAQKYYDLADRYYRENQQVNAAIRMWIKLGNWERAALCWQDLQQWDEAAVCWQKNGQMERAAICWQHAGKWSEAKKCWLNLDRLPEAAICDESEQRWQSAIAIWLNLGQLERAARCHEKINQWESAEQLWRQLGYWGCVAIALQQQGKWREAAQAWNKTNPVEQEAICYEQAQEWERAEQCWRRANNWEKVAIAAERQEKWQNAAEIWQHGEQWKRAGLAWERIEETERAAQSYENGECWREAERCWRKLERWDRVVLMCEQQEKWLEAAEIWQNLAQWHRAALVWEKIEETEKAAQCYERGEYWREAEQCWRKLNNWDKVEYACSKQGKWQQAAYTWLKANQIEKAALCYENCQDWANAEKYWRESDNWPKVALACERQDKWREAAEAHLKIGNLEKAAIFSENCQDWPNAEKCWRQLWQWEKVALACEYQNKWGEAAEVWLLINETEKAGICYERAQEWAKAEECWRKINNWQRIGIACEHQDKWEEAAQVWQFLSEWKKAALASLKIDDLEAAAKYYEKGNYSQEAEECWQRLNNLE